MSHSNYRSESIQREFFFLTVKKWFSGNSVTFPDTRYDWGLLIIRRPPETGFNIIGHDFWSLVSSIWICWEIIRELAESRLSVDFTGTQKMKLSSLTRLLRSLLFIGALANAPFAISESDSGWVLISGYNLLSFQHRILPIPDQISTKNPLNLSLLHVTWM